MFAACAFADALVFAVAQIHPDVGISRKAMSVLNSFTMDIFQRLASQARTCCMESERTHTHTDDKGDSEGQEGAHTLAAPTRLCVLQHCTPHHVELARHPNLCSVCMSALRIAVRSRCVLSFCADCCCPSGRVWRVLQSRDPW